MNEDYLTLSPNDLVLKLNDEAKSFDVSKYDDFIYELCGDWDFQREAIEKAIKFYLSGVYSDTKELFVENYNNNEIMQNFQKLESFATDIPLPNKLACTIDLATATGKSWVIYAVARILLAEGVVDQVLVLVPSKTIKRELYQKFKTFSEQDILTDSLPEDSVYPLPGIIQSNKTIEAGVICVDNVHRTYDHVSSSITSSLEGKGERTLVINDEAHHILNPKATPSEGSKMREWKKFLIDERYNFKYILNTTGTAYKGDRYFLDVLYKFSIRQAIDKEYIKDINYLTKDGSENWEQKWKAILNNHNKLKEKYTEAKKHITIVVTNTIKNTDVIAEKIKTVLRTHTDLSEDEIEQKVIPVTSSDRHRKEREVLKTVDSSNNKVEWIVSVSMLTEGWDVKNIFQIVPHDKRAFKSKLLISQVLGRGLRIPKEYRNTGIHPIVWVYNHDAWSKKIDHYVREVAEISDKRLTSEVLGYSEYNFKVHSISIDKEIKSKEKVPADEEIKLPETLGFKTTKEYVEAEFTEVRNNRLHNRVTYIGDTIKHFTVEQATNEIISYFYMFDAYKETNISSRLDPEYIRNLIRKELNKINEETVSEPNMQRAKQSFGVLIRQFVGSSHIEDVYDELFTIDTKEINSYSLSKNSFIRYGALFACNEYLENLPKNNKDIIEELKEIINEDQQATFFIPNLASRMNMDLDKKNYKSPLDITLVSYKPERKFVNLLVNDYSEYIEAWIKSRDRGFYKIPYIHRPGTHSKQKNFNPDFIIKKIDKIIIVETKSEDDSTVKNKDKLDGAIKYFDALNNYTGVDLKYEFHFLDERDYADFFEKVIKNNEEFKSDLQVTLESKSREELKGEV